MAKTSKVLVNFKRGFITPEGSRLRVSGNPHKVPGDWVLPKDAEVLGPAEDEEPKVEKPKAQPNPPKVDLTPKAG